MTINRNVARRRELEAQFPGAFLANHRPKHLVAERKSYPNPHDCIPPDGPVLRSGRCFLLADNWPWVPSPGRVKPEPIEITNDQECIRIVFP